MTTQRPTAREIEQLVAYLPRLSAEGFVAVRRWGGGETDANGRYVMPWPVYDEVVNEFFEAAGQDCWMDFDYVPVERRASLDEIRTMLTYCVRGERFSEGHWGAMIEQGHVRRLLERLAEIAAKQG
jgi:hypothetical protein